MSLQPSVYLIWKLLLTPSPFSGSSPKLAKWSDCCDFAGILQVFCPSFVRFLPFDDQVYNANAHCTHSPNVSCLVEAVLFWLWDPSCHFAKIQENKVVLFLNPEMKSNLLVHRAHWHDTGIFKSFWECPLLDRILVGTCQACLASAPLPVQRAVPQSPNWRRQWQFGISCHPPSKSPHTNC